MGDLSSSRCPPNMTARLAGSSITFLRPRSYRCRSIFSRQCVASNQRTDAANTLDYSGNCCIGRPGVTNDNPAADNFFSDLLCPPNRDRSTETYQIDVAFIG